jgi:CDGSH-type Zn-finger protein
VVRRSRPVGAQVLSSLTNRPEAGPATDPEGEDPMAEVKITVRENGPYRIEAPAGALELFDAAGNRYDLTGKTAFALCRCGHSENKPFCDGAHKRVGFPAPSSAGGPAAPPAAKP